MVLAPLLLPLLLAKPVPAAPPPRRMHKLARVLELEETRNAGAGELDRYLRDPDRSIRRRAALAAGRLADRSLVPTLVDLMNDGEAEVRQMAAFALGLVGDPRAAERLLASLKDTEPMVRARAAEALGRLGDPRLGPELAAFVVAQAPPTPGIITIRGDNPADPRDPWVELRLALFSLLRLEDAKAAATALLAGNEPRFDWWAAAFVAARLESPLLKPVLVAAAASTDPLARAFAARGLGALKDESRVDLVITLARDRDENVAVTALKALAVIGDPRGVPAAAAHLGSRSTALQREALRTLAQLPGDRGLRDRLVPLVGAKEPWLRGPALQALARADRDTFALVLSSLDPDPDWTVRAALAAALADVGDEVALGVLYTMLKDSDSRVLPAVLEAVRKARGTDAVDILRRHLEHPDFRVRAAAAEGLAALKAPGQADALLAAWKRALSDGADVDARLAVIAALAIQPDPRAKEALAEIASGDPFRVVRGRAAQALAAPGALPTDPGPERARPFADYRVAMGPYDTRPGLDLYSPRAFIKTRHGSIEVLLDVVETPLTTASFVDLARRGFYDGLTFHRVEPNFVVQGGCPRGDGHGGPGYLLRCEISQRPYGRGAVGMALSGKDTGGSQFFITHSPQPHLDGGYTLFGQVVKGLEVVDQIRPGDVIERVEIWDRPVTRVRLLVLDIDGTLLTSEKKISPRTRAAVSAARERGVRLVLATGRRYPSTRPVAEDLGGFIPLVLHNGALVMEGEEVLRCKPLPRDLAVETVALARAHGLDPVVHCGQRGEGLLLVEARARSAGLVSYYLERSREHVREVEDAAALDEDPMQVMLGGAPAALQDVRPPLARLVEGRARVERTTYPRTGVEILDVLHPEVGKAGAVAFLQSRYGVPAAETLAIGDNWNDREMLEQAGIGLVMGGGDPELLRLGLPVLPSSDEDGVAVAIERHLL